MGITNANDDERQHDDKKFLHGTMANPEMMQSMMGEMMKDGKTMTAMMQMMQQGGYDE
jgi:hypothetical protein